MWTISWPESRFHQSIPSKQCSEIDTSSSTTFSTFPSSLAVWKSSGHLLPSHSSSHGHPVLDCWSCCVSLAIPRWLPVSKVETFHFSTWHPAWHLRSESNTGDPLWLEVLRHFFCCKGLLSLGSMHIVPPALKQVIEEEMTDMLPVIRELSVSGSLPAEPVREAIERFVTARGVPAFEWLSDIGVTVPWPWPAAHSNMGECSLL
jgi:hypothetical protein